MLGVGFVAGVSVVDFGRKTVSCRHVDKGEKMRDREEVLLSLQSAKM